MSLNKRAGFGGLIVMLALGAWWAAPATAQTSPAAQPLPIDVTGVTFAEIDDATGITRMEGSPLVVTRGRTVIKAIRARYDRRTHLLTAEGAVEATDQGVTIRADAVEYRLDDESVRASGNVRMTSIAQGASGEQVPTTLATPEVSGSLRTKRFVAAAGVTIVRGAWTVSGRRGEYDDGTKTAVVTGDPHARFGDGMMTADVLIFFLDAETLRAEGAVQLRRGDLTGRARRADVSMKTQLAVLTGNARVDRGADSMTADVIETTLDGQRITARGTSRLVVTSPDPTVTRP